MKSLGPVWGLAIAATWSACSFPTERFSLGGPGADTGVPTDTTVPDTVAPDTAVADSGPADTPAVDSALGDTAVADTAPPDTTAPDTTAPDTMGTDAGPSRCGVAGARCPVGQVCQRGDCVAACPAGTMDCAGFCRTLTTDDGNCGSCGRACAAGEVCRAGACTTSDGTFRIAALTSDHCVTVEQTTSVPGLDDRGGIAVSTSQVFYTGDAPDLRMNPLTVRYRIGDLGGGVSTGAGYDALVGNVRDGTVFTFTSGSTPLPSLGGTASRLQRLDGATGALIPGTAGAVGLSPSLELRSMAVDSSVGIFAGFDRVVVHVGMQVFNISLRPATLGAVTEIARLPPLAHVACESWAYWGVAESFGGNVYLVYARDRTTIVRTRLPDGMTAGVATFTDLGDLCGFTVSPAQGRWYFHHENTSQFRSMAGAGEPLDETLGFCDATFER